MADPFSSYAFAPDSPAQRSEPVTANGTEFDSCRGLFVGTGGNIVGRLKDDTVDRTFKNVPAGATLPFRFKQITSAGTTAGDFLALY